MTDSMPGLEIMKKEFWEYRKKSKGNNETFLKENNW